MSARHRNRAGGYTLIELLVAIVVLGLLMTAAFGALGIGSRSLAAGIERADRNEDIRAAADFLRRQFAQLVPYRWHDGEDTRIAFAGDQRTLRFLAPGPEGSDAGQLVVTLSVALHEDHREVWVGAAPLDPGSDDWFDREPATRTRLAAELADARIAYFGSTVAGETAAWHPEWQSDAEFFPAAVRLELEPADGAPARPGLIFRIPSGGER